MFMPIGPIRIVVKSGLAHYRVTSSLGEEKENAATTEKNHKKGMKSLTMRTQPETGKSTRASKSPFPYSHSDL